MSEEAAPLSAKKYHVSPTEADREELLRLINNTHGAESLHEALLPAEAMRLADKHTTCGIC